MAIARKIRYGGIVLALALAAVVSSVQWQKPRLDMRHDPDDRREHGERVRRAGPGGEAFWNWRVSYPTGKFDAAWYDQALPQHQRMAKGLPATVHAKIAAAGVLDAERVTALGPAPLDWTSDYGLVAGRVNVIVTHPTNASVAWIGSDGGGVWKTTNCCGADTHWRVTTDAPQIANIAIDALVLDPHDPDTLYAGTGDFDRNRPFAFGASGVLKSSDGGETWTALASDVFTPVYTQPAGDYPQRRSISALAVDPRAAQNVVAGTNQGLYFSHDAGVSWQGPCLTNPFTSQRQDVTGLLAIANGTSTDLVVAIGSLSRPSSVREDEGNNGANGIYRAPLPASGCPAAWSILSRADNGWPAGSASGTPSSGGGNPLGRIDLAVAPGDSRILYAQVMNAGVWRSSDGGTSWSQTATQPDSFASGCAGDSFGDGMLAQDYNAGLLIGANPDLVFLSATDLWRSTDGGRTFIDLTCAYDHLANGQPGIVHPDHHARAFVGGDNAHLLIGTDGGMYATNDALDPVPQFAAINGGANTIEFYSGDLTPAFDDPATATRGIAGGAQDNGSSVHVWEAGAKPALAAWKEAFGGDGTFVKIEPMLQQNWYYGTQFGYIAASVTGPHGNADQLVTPEDPNTHVDWQGDRTGFLTPFELYKFGDAHSCPPTAGCQRMIAGTYRVWESLSGGLPNTSWYVNSPDLTKALADDDNLSVVNKVAFAYGDAGIAMAGSNDGNVWLGFDMGSGHANSASWVDVTGNNAVLPNRPVMDVVGHPATPAVVYASLAGFDQNTPHTPGHVFELTCDARCAHFSWSNKSGNLPNIPVNAILINPNLPSQAFAGTDWGLYFTDDIGASTPQWQRFGAGLPSAMIWSLVIDRGATTLAIFTRSRGAYVWPLPRGATLSSSGTVLGTDAHKRSRHVPAPAIEPRDLAR